MQKLWKSEQGDDVSLGNAFFLCYRRIHENLRKNPLESFIICIKNLKPCRLSPLLQHKPQPNSSQIERFLTFPFYFILYLCNIKSSFSRTHVTLQLQRIQLRFFFSVVSLPNQETFSVQSSENYCQNSLLLFSNFGAENWIRIENLYLCLEDLCWLESRLMFEVIECENFLRFFSGMVEVSLWFWMSENWRKNKERDSFG